MILKDKKLFFFYKENQIYIDNIFKLIENEINIKKYKVSDKESLFKDLLLCIYNNSYE